jgi:hypothetical protein
MRAWRFWVVAFLALWTSSCFELRSIRWESQDVYLKYDAQSDTAEMLLVYNKVFARDPDSHDMCVAIWAVEAIAARKRYFVIADWFGEFDPDDVLHLDEADDGGEEDQVPRDAVDPTSTEARAAEFARGIEIADAAVFRNALGELAIAQRVRMPHFSVLTSVVNAGISNSLSEGTAADGPFTDAEFAAWRARAASGAPWFSVAPGSIEFRAPFGSRWMAELMRTIADPGNAPLVPALTGALTEIAVEGGDVAFRWNADETQTLHLHFGTPRGHPKDYEPDLSGYLETRGMKIERRDSDEFVRAFRR